MIDRRKAAEEGRLDGKYLLLTSDDSLSSEDVALGYRQLMEVERAWRSLESELDLRPMYHRLDDRIRAHVLICWLALLLIRVVEVRTETPWTACIAACSPPPTARWSSARNWTSTSRHCPGRARSDPRH